MPASYGLRYDLPAHSAKVLFRADASAAIGGGHIMRCLSLAGELRRLGASCVFACGPQSKDSVPDLMRAGYDIIDVDPAKANDLLAPAGGCDWLVVDHYGWNESDEKACRSWAKNIMVIDDLADRRHDCDLLLDQTYGRSDSAYRNLIANSSDVLLGSDYALLRPEFAARRAFSVPRRSEGQLKRVLVTMGLTDPANVTSVVLQGIIQSGLRLKVDVVLGPSAPYLADVAGLVAEHADVMTLHVGTPSIADLMSEADLAFGAAGTSSWERCCLGLPTVLTIIADNQREIASQLGGQGAAVVVGAEALHSPDAFADILCELNEDRSRLVALAQRSSAICDGRGVYRAAMRLLPEFIRTGQPIWLRPAGEQDADMLYTLRMQPDARQFSRSTGPSSRDEHAAWMRMRLKDASSLLNIIVCGGEAVGSVRLDRRSGDSCELSILIASAQQRRGIAQAALVATRRLVPEAGIVADVMRGNDASEALFTKAGYRRGEDGMWFMKPLMATAGGRELH